VCSRLDIYVLITYLFNFYIYWHHVVYNINIFSFYFFSSFTDKYQYIKVPDEYYAKNALCALD